MAIEHQDISTEFSSSQLKSMAAIGVSLAFLQNGKFQEYSIAGLAERGFDGEQMTQVRNMVDAQDCDLFDVLNCIAHTKAPLKRIERADTHRASILSRYDAKQLAFLEFFLSQYVAEGVDELSMEKLPDLLDLKYGSPSDAVQELGSVSDIRNTFKGFQKGLYED